MYYGRVRGRGARGGFPVLWRWEGKQLFLYLSSPQLGPIVLSLICLYFPRIYPHSSETQLLNLPLQRQIAWLPITVQEACPNPPMMFSLCL